MTVIPDLTQSPYLLDILDQPLALERTLNGLQQLEFRPLRAVTSGTDKHRIVLTGMGSSFSALYPLWLRLLRARRSAILIETAELIHSAGALLDADTLFVIPLTAGVEHSVSCKTYSLLDEYMRQFLRKPPVKMTFA